MPDPIIKELWNIKDAIARKHGYNLDSLVRSLREHTGAEGRRVVDLSAQKKACGKTPAPPKAAGA